MIEVRATAQAAHSRVCAYAPPLHSSSARPSSRQAALLPSHGSPTCARLESHSMLRPETRQCWGPRHGTCTAMRPSTQCMRFCPSALHDAPASESHASPTSVTDASQLMRLPCTWQWFAPRHGDPAAMRPLVHVSIDCPSAEQAASSASHSSLAAAMEVSHTARNGPCCSQ